MSSDDPVVAASGTVVLGGVAVSLNCDLGADFVRDCARNVEALLPERELRTKYQLSNEDWAELASNEQLLRAIRTELDRRIVIHVRVAVRR